MQIFLFFALFISILAVTFALQNSTPVQVTFIAWKIDSSLAQVLLVAMGSGALISFFFSLPSNVKARWTIRKQQKRVAELETRLAESQFHLEELENKPAVIENQEKPLPIAALPAPVDESEPEEDSL